MRKTEKEYWVNGHQVRGKNSHSFAFSFGSIAFLICYTPMMKYFSFDIYKLVPKKYIGQNI